MIESYQWIKAFHLISVIAWMAGMLYLPRLFVYHAGAEPDVAGPLGGGGDEDLGRGDQLPAGRVVLADPGLVVAELIEPLDQLQVAVNRQRGILAHAVKRRHEDAEVHASIRCHVVPRSSSVDAEESALP